MSGLGRQIRPQNNMGVVFGVQPVQQGFFRPGESMETGHVNALACKQPEREFPPGAQGLGHSKGVQAGGGPAAFAQGLGIGREYAAQAFQQKGGKGCGGGFGMGNVRGRHPAGQAFLKKIRHMKAPGEEQRGRVHALRSGAVCILPCARNIGEIICGKRFRGFNARILGAKIEEIRTACGLKAFIHQAGAVHEPGAPQGLARNPPVQLGEQG